MPGLTAGDAWRGILDPESIETAQLAPGDLFIDRSATEIGPARILSGACEVDYRGHSDLLTGKTIIGVVGDVSSDARWFGERLRPGDIFQSQTSMDLTVHGHSKLYYVAIDTDKLEPNDGCRIHSNPGFAERLRQCLSDAIEFSRVRDSTSEGFCRAFESTIVPLLALSLSETATSSGTRTHSRRIAAVRTCEAYVREHIIENPTLADLSAVSGLRMRSLINAFQAVIGMSPMTYLRVQRLNEVRKALLEVDPRNTRVIDVAHTWGFWHMGHFTQYYRAMFHEVPSATLSRAR